MVLQGVLSVDSSNITMAHGVGDFFLHINIMRYHVRMVVRRDMQRSVAIIKLFVSSILYTFDLKPSADIEWDSYIDRVPKGEGMHSFGR